MKKYGLTLHEASYFISSDIVTTDMYSEKDDSIDILYKNGMVKDISVASDMLNIELLSKKSCKILFCLLKMLICIYCHCL